VVGYMTESGTDTWTVVGKVDGKEVSNKKQRMPELKHTVTQYTTAQHTILIPHHCNIIPCHGTVFGAEKSVRV
jgi:hypothetical protein